MDDISALEFIILLWVLGGICLVFIVARLAVRTWKRLWMFWQSEAWLVLAAANYMFLVIGTHYWWAKGVDDIGSIYNVGWNKWQWITIFSSEIGYYFPRFSLLAFYNELFPVSEERLRKALYGVTILSIISFFIALFSNLFWCGVPISKNWYLDSWNDCSLILTNDVFKVTWPFNITCELLTFMLPFGMLRRLTKTPRRERIALGCLFGLGIISIALSIARFAFAMKSIFLYSSTVVGSAEIVGQIVVCAAPALRPLLPFFHIGWSKMKSIFTGKTTRSEDEGNLKGSCSSRGGGDQEMGQHDGKFPSLATWHSSEGGNQDLEPRHSQEEKT